MEVVIIRSRHVPAGENFRDRFRGFYAAVVLAVVGAKVAFAE